MSLVAAPGAHAGQYVHLYDCGDSAQSLHLPGAPNNSDGAGWIARASGIPGSLTAFSCSGGNGMYAQLNSTTSDQIGDGDWSGFTYNAPAATKITGFETQWTGFTAPGDGTRRGAMHAVVSRGYDLISRAGQGNASGTYTFATPLDDTTLRVGAYCSADPSYNCWSNALTSWVNLIDPAVRLVDESNPVAGMPTGLAVNDSTWKGSKDLSYSASDTGSGMAKFRLYVDGQLKDEHSVVSGGYYAPLCVVSGTNSEGFWVFGYPKPCPDSISRTESIDTTALPDGQHTITTKVVDASQNTTTLYSASKLIANDPPVNTALPSFADAAARNAFAAPVQGNTLTFNDHGTWTGPNLSIVSAWLRCDRAGLNCVQIPGASALSYTATGDDLDHTLKLAVTATNPADSVTVYSYKSGLVTAPKSSSDVTTKPTDGANGSTTNNTTSIVSVPSLPSTPTSDKVAHTFVGRIAGEPAGTVCPSDKATLKFEHVKGGQMTLRFGKGSTAQAVLTCTNTGKAITGGNLELATKTGAHPAVASDLTTDGAGHATLRLAKGASRGVTVGYRMYADDSIVRASATLKVLVDSKVSLKANKKHLQNGKAVTLRGSVAGGEVPKRGVTIAVQWKDGKRWRPFAQIKTNTKGTFAYAYKFTRTNKTISYQLRVQVAKGQIDYPYAATASKPVTVTVAP